MKIEDLETELNALTSRMIEDCEELNSKFERDIADALERAEAAKLSIVLVEAIVRHQEQRLIAASSSKE